MRDLFIKWFMSFNAFLVRLTNGRVGGKLGTQTILLLETTGRKSGQPRVIPIAYFFHEGKYLVVGSNWGRDKHADWYLNLKKKTRATLTVNGEKIRAEAYEAQSDEYARLWKFVTERHPPYLDYQKMTARHIPVMVFQPLDK